MSNIEKIRQEIERRKGYISVTHFAEDLLSFIDSLPEEKPSEDLNDEIKKFIEEYGYESGEDKLLIAIVARHFAEWQKQRDAELIEIVYNDGITIGKTKQKEQMLKDAVEGEVVQDMKGLYHAKSVAFVSDNSYKFGDKVKIIIVKED